VGRCEEGLASRSNIPRIRK